MYFEFIYNTLCNTHVAHSHDICSSTMRVVVVFGARVGFGGIGFARARLNRF